MEYDEVGLRNWVCSLNFDRVNKGQFSPNRPSFGFLILKLETFSIKNASLLIPYSLGICVIFD